MLTTFRRTEITEVPTVKVRCPYCGAEHRHLVLGRTAASNISRL